MSRLATHSGSWYTDDPRKLDEELSEWMSHSHSIKGSKAIIAPHAGYSYSGPAAAWAYNTIDTDNTPIKRVFILGPSHHLYIDGCALSPCTEYTTSLGNLPLDTQTIQELAQSGKFKYLTIEDDQEEHSIEMHLPYIRKTFEGKQIQIVPILVGSISKEQEISYGALLAPYLARDDTFCVVSSDFCHWGTRFQYTHYYPSSDATKGIQLSRSSRLSSLPIHESISKLDHEAMSILTIPPNNPKHAHEEFSQYLSTTSNTICGRHPIGVLLGALSYLQEQNQTESSIGFVRYEQSSQCQTIRDSSVSYASAWVKF